jgi:hypothetical protein
MENVKAVFTFNKMKSEVEKINDAIDEVLMPKTLPAGKIVMVTMFDEKCADFGAICLTSLKKFSGAMGCDVVSYDHLFDVSLAGSWNKLFAVADAMKALNDNDWVVWVDADCVLNREFNIRADLESVPRNVHMLVTTDWNDYCLCLFAMRKCQWSTRMLDAMLLCGDVRNDATYGIGLGCKWEQNTFKALVSNFPSIESHTQRMGKRWCHADRPEEGDRNYLVPFHHYGGRTKSERMFFMNNAATYKR